jgi:hypothetical protein
MVKKVKIAMNHTLNAKFDAHSSVSFKCTGGNPSILGTPSKPVPNSFNKWIKTLTKNPTAIHNSQKMRPLDDFIDNYSKRKNLRTAILKRMNLTGHGPTTEEVERWDAEHAKKKATAAAKAKTVAAPSVLPHKQSIEVPVASTTKGAAVLAVPGVCTGFGGVGVGCGYVAPGL